MNSDLLKPGDIGALTCSTVGYHDSGATIVIPKDAIVTIYSVERHEYAIDYLVGMVYRALVWHRQVKPVQLGAEGTCSNT
jgi:hypothetical protein